MIHCLTEAVGMLVCSLYHMYNVAEGWKKVHKYQSGVPSWKMLISWCVCMVHIITSGITVSRVFGCVNFVCVGWPG